MQNGWVDGVGLQFKVNIGPVLGPAPVLAPVPVRFQSSRPCMEDCVVKCRTNHTEVSWLPLWLTQAFHTHKHTHNFTSKTTHTQTHMNHVL